MSGESELKEAQARLASIEKALDDYEGRVGLPKFQPHSEAEQYLNMSHKELRRLSHEDCGEAAAVLAQYAFHLQRAYNEEEARVSWAEDTIVKDISEQVTQYHGASYEERKLKAIQGAPMTRGLERIRAYARARAKRLQYLASRVEFLAKTMMELQQTKRREAYGNGNRGLAQT